MMNHLQGCRPRHLYALILATLLALGISGHAAMADSVASLTVQASQPSPAIIGPGDSYNVIFQSQLVANESGVENLTATGQTWVITSVAYSGDDVNWTTLWSGSASAVTVAAYGVSFGLNGGIGVAELTGETTADTSGSTTVGVAAAAAAAPALTPELGSTVVATPDGFYMVNVSTSVNYTATVNGNPHQGQANGSGSTTEPVAQITNLTVGSPATQTNMLQDYPNQGDINYGVVKKSSDQPTANAMATATTSPATTAVENQVKWSNGTAVTGNGAERDYSLTSSQRYTIGPTLGGHSWKGHNVYLWVIWATVTIDSAGADPVNSPEFPSGQPGGQSLGIQYGAAKDETAFNNCQIALVTPAGVYTAIGAGCAMKQLRYVHDFKNVAQHGQFWDMGWQNDSPRTGNYTIAPDSDDKVYAIDGPNQYLLSGETQDDEYGNFKDHMEWNGTTCSNVAEWYFEAGAKQSANPEIYFAQGGTGQITIPKTDPQKAESPN